MARGRITVAVIGEGITEYYYMNSLRDILNIKPTSIKPKKSNIQELENAIKKCISKGYDQVYCLIDLDNKVYDGNPDHEKNGRDYEKLKRLYHNKSHKCPNGGSTQVQMIESFPSTEIFFRYYFGYTSAILSNQQLKKQLNLRYGYSTEEKYLIKHSIHNTLTSAGGSLEIAIAASMQSVSMSKGQSEQCPFSEIGSMIRCLINNK